MPGTWKALQNQPSFGAAHMLLLTDGTVLVQQNNAANWYLLTPDANGDYANGHWSSAASSVLTLGNSSDPDTITYAPTFYASGVLANGMVFFAGGELNQGQDANSNVCAMFDPIARYGWSWCSVASPTVPNGTFNIADAPCCVLPDGRFLLGATAVTESPFVPGQATAIFDPVKFIRVVTGSAPNQAFWSAGPNNPGTNWEQTWALLPDGTVLAPSVAGPGLAATTAAYKFVVNGNQSSCVSAGNTPQSLAGTTTETGPAMLLPNGTTVNFGATGHNAIYTPSSSPAELGTWTAAPDLPSDPNGVPYTTSDAPAVLLPNGNVLVMAGSIDSGGHSGEPVVAFEYYPGRAAFSLGTRHFPAEPAAFLPVTAPPNTTSWTEDEALQMLLLPTGEVMVSAGSTDIELYEPDGTYDSPWAPTITNGPTLVHPGDNGVILHGTQMNGLSQACSFGDDASMATNYPLVRIVNIATGHVRYCRAHDHSTMGVTGAAIVSTQFDVPADVEIGASQLYVVANGMPSQNWPLDVVAAGALGRLVAQITSPAIPMALNRAVTFTVHATDSVTAAVVPGNVLIDGAFAGHTDSPITHTFEETVKTKVTPTVLPLGKGGMQTTTTTTTYPKITAAAPEYASASVNTGWRDTVTVRTQPIPQVPKP